jgi:Flp pilus assembly pilin Flp
MQRSKPLWTLCQRHQQHLKNVALPARESRRERFIAFTSKGAMMKVKGDAFPSFGSTEDGAAAIEYALLGSLIAAVIAITVGVLGILTNGNFCAFVSRMGGAC